MDELFIFKWEVLNENPIKIRGHGLDKNNQYDFIIVDNFETFCYYNVEGEMKKWKSKDIISTETSDDIFTTRNFTKVYSRYKKELRGYMSELEIIPMFTAIRNIDYVGWIDKKTLQPIRKNIHPDPYILSFDIEVSSDNDGMPVPYIENNRIEMISLLFQRYKEEDTKTYLLHIDPIEYPVDRKFTGTCCKNEIELIDTFFEIIKKENPDIITGFNIYGFDFEYIISKLQYYYHITTQCTRPVLKDFTVKSNDWSSSAYGSNKYQMIQIDGRIVFDTYLYFKRFKLEKYSLDVISQKYLNETKEDMSYKEMAWSVKVPTRFTPLLRVGLST